MPLFAGRGAGAPSPNCRRIIWRFCAKLRVFVGANLVAVTSQPPAYPLPLFWAREMNAKGEGN